MYSIKSYDTLMHTTFERISKGIYFDDKLIPFERKLINDVMSYFEEREEFEKCQTIKNILEQLDHNKNFHQWVKKK